MLIEAGLATYDDSVYISTTADYGSGECNVYYYSIEGGSWFRWLKLAVNLVGIVLDEGDSEDIVHFLDEEGFFSQASDSSKLAPWQKIADAGVYSESAKNYGYLNTLRILDGDLYAVGRAGQIYRKRKTDTDWAHFDQGILQRNIDHKTPTENVIDLQDIAGNSEDLYCCGGYGKLFHFSKQKWRKIKIPSVRGDLSQILYKSADDVYVCGYHGTLLHGNQKTGFTSICPEHITAHFIGMADHGGQFYLCDDSNTLYRCDYTGENFEQINVLDRDDISFNKLISTGDILWSIGFREVHYLDGETWNALPSPALSPES